MNYFRFVILPGEEHSKLDDKKLDDFEEQYQLHFPESLRNYYLDYNGARIADISFTMDDRVFYVYRITPLLGEKDSVQHALERAARYHDMPEHLVRIADDMGNGLYYWDTRNEHVYFRRVDNMSSYTFICKGLDHFFEILNQAYWRDTAYDITEMTRRDREMANIDFLPLGSIVLLKGGIRKVLIIGRGLNVKKDNETYFFDYGGVLYPDGLTGDQMVYFNADGISKVYFQGYQDDDNDIILNSLNNYLLEHPDVKRADPEKWNA